MTKYEALVNAQGVYAWAMFFEHGILHQLVNWGSVMQFTVHFPYGEFNHEREDDMFRSVVVTDAEFEWTDRPDLHIEVLYIRWNYSD